MSLHRARLVSLVGALALACLACAPAGRAGDGPRPAGRDAAPPDAQALVGRWRVDLRPTPGAERRGFLAFWSAQRAGAAAR
jgi:hypothetical protein